MQQNKNSGALPLTANCVTLLLTLAGAVFFALSYMTGYIGIVYGEKNSEIITIELVAVVLINVFLICSQVKEKWGNKLIYEILTYILVIVITSMTLFLLVDRVDAIGNCIVAPWDAGHGGEDSCYLSFVSLGCWCVCLIVDIILCFVGYKKELQIEVENG